MKTFNEFLVEKYELDEGKLGSFFRASVLSAAALGVPKVPNAQTSFNVTTNKPPAVQQSVKQQISSTSEIEKPATAQQPSVKQPAITPTQQQAPAAASSANKVLTKDTEFVPMRPPPGLSQEKRALRIKTMGDRTKKLIDSLGHRPEFFE